MGIVRQEFRHIIEEINKGIHFKVLENLNKELKGRPFILYGCGQICKKIISICLNLGIKIDSLCDSNKTGLFEDTGYSIISPKELIEKYADAAIMITSQRYENEIAEQLRRLGFPNRHIYPFPFLHSYIMDTNSFEASHLEGFEHAYDFFNDSTSRQIVLNRMRMHLTGTSLVKTSSAPIYFEPGVINLYQDEIFIDGGCFKGETAEEFIKQIEIRGIGEYSHIYSFEPDIDTREIAIENLKHYMNIDVIAKGLWSSETELKFFSDGGRGGSSFVLGQTSVSVPVTSLDKFFEGKQEHELPTFIKMDIEGAEKEAIIGAKNIIKQNHPKLAICVYHKPEDIYQLPQLIYEIDSSYKFTLQQYEDGVYDTVLYAV
jgi:FkbM family methyltransferase